MANQHLTIAMVSFETLDELDNACVLGNLVNREYDSRFAVSGAKVGDSYTIRKPDRYEVQSGEAMGTVQDIQDNQVVIQIEHQDHIPMQFGQAERALSIDDFRRRHVKPQATALTNKVDKRLHALYPAFYANSGSPSSVPTNSSVYTDGLVKLANMGVPMDENLSITCSPRMMQQLIDGEKALFHAARAIERAYIRGEIGEAHGAMWYRTQNSPVHTVGAMGGTPAVSGASQTGSSLLVSGLSASITGWGKKGDTFTVAGVNGAHVQGGEDTGELQQQTLLADVDSAGGGTATLSCSPGFITSGPLKTVQNSPANGALLTFNGTGSETTRQGLLFHKDAMGLTIVDLPAPMGGTDFSPVRSKKYRMAFQMTADFEIRTYQNIVRTDILYATTVYWSEYGHRIYSLS